MVHWWFFPVNGWRTWWKVHSDSGHRLPYCGSRHEEVFRFGAGAPLVSTRAMLYPVALGNSGVLSWLRLALVENTASDPRVEQCPALIGPSELARWDITFDFANRRLTVKGQPQEMELSNTRHPVLTMVEDGRSFAEWKTPALEELKERLTKDPYSLAMLQESFPNLEEESESEPEVRTAVMAVEVGEEKEVQELAEWQAELETVAIHETDKVMATLPPGALVEGAMQSSDSEGSLSEAETETSHALNEAESESSTSEDEEWERHEVMTEQGTEETAFGCRAQDC